MTMAHISYSCYQVFTFFVILHCIHSAQIVTVLDKSISDLNPNLQTLLTPPVQPNMSLVLSTNDTVSVLNSVCKELQQGASVLFDMSSVEISPLLRSFARAHNLLVISMLDTSQVQHADAEYPYFFQIIPPASAILKIIQDIVIFDNLTNVAIFYDSSFDLQSAPQRSVSGQLSDHLYLPLDKNNTIQHLADIRAIEIQNVFIIGTSSSADFVLGKVNKQLGEEDINWFVITKDAKITCDACVTSMRIIVIRGEYTSATSFVSFMTERVYRNFDSFQIKVDEAFAYDLLKIFGNLTALESQPVHTDNFSCFGSTNNSSKTTSKLSDLMEYLQNVSHAGVFGPVKSAGNVLQQEIGLKIHQVDFYSGNQLASKYLGNWTEKEGLTINRHSLIREKERQMYRVVIIPEYEPYVYREEWYDNGTEKHVIYKGLCIDLFEEIARRLDFDYELYESKDGYFGSLMEDGTWNGAIYELIEKRADIAIGPISVMSERENVVDFTVPYNEPVGLTILMKKSKFEYSLTRFLNVLEPEVWGCIVASFFLFSTLMWLFDKFSPFSYQNHPDRDNSVEKRVFTAREGIWFCMTSLTPQGGGEAPKAVSGRLVAATWWLYGFLLVAFYTANLAAFLTVTRLDKPITSLEDLSQQQNVEYGPLNGSSALIYFNRMQSIEDKFYQIWKDMSLNESLSPAERAQLAVWDYPVSEQFTKLKSRMHISNNSKVALERVRRGELALINDRSRNRYQMLTDCDVEEIGEEFSRKPFAFALTQGSPLRAPMSNVILELSNMRFLEELTNKWWDLNEKKIHCDRIEDESDGISIQNIGGVFLVIAIGTGMSLIAFTVEYYYYKIKPMKEARLYSMHGHTDINRIQSEVSFDHVQIDKCKNPSSRFDINTSEKNKTSKEETRRKGVVKYLRSCSTDSIVCRPKRRKKISFRFNTEE